MTGMACLTMAAGVGLYARLHHPPAPLVPAPGVGLATVDASRSITVAAPTASAAAPRGAASAMSGDLRKPLMPPVEAAAESLRKVQIALAGGTAQEALTGALELESCAHADRTAGALMQFDVLKSMMPDVVKKMLDGFPSPSAEIVARAQADQRRCQVFDAGTLARRRELYEKAYEGGAEGSAQPYLAWLQSEDGSKDGADRALIGRLQASIRADANAANLATLATFAYGGSYTATQSAADPVEAQAYREAYFRIVDETSTASAARAQVDTIVAMGLKPPSLTPEQQRDADLLTGRIVNAWHRRARPKE